MGTQSAQGRPASVVVLEDSKEGRLVPNISNVSIVEIVEPCDELIGPTERRNERSLVLRHVEAVLPYRALKGLLSIVRERAGCSSVVECGADKRILKAPGTVQKLRLEETREACRCRRVEQVGRLVSAEQVFPVFSAAVVKRGIIRMAEIGGQASNDKVVVRVFKRARNRAGERAEALVVKVLNGYIAKSFPGVKPATSLVAPVVRFVLGIIDNRFVAEIVVNAACKVFNVCISDNYIGIRAALGIL